MSSEIELGVLALPVAAGVLGGITALFNKKVGMPAKIVGGLTAAGAAFGSYILMSIMTSEDRSGAGMVGMVLYPAINAAALVLSAYCLGATVEAMRHPAPPAPKP